MNFFNNKNNDNLKFKINAEGINTTDVEARLVFATKENINYILFGNIKENVCTFEVPELKVYEANKGGKVRFELVAKDLYFNVWEDSFKIKAKTTIKLDEMISETVKESKPTIQLSAQPMIETNENDVVETINEKKEIEVETPKEFKSFSSFFNKE